MSRDHVHFSGHKRPGNWTQWSDWSACSKPCGTGHQLRTRQCNSTKIEYCTGEEQDARQCNNYSCEGNQFDTNTIREALDEL